MGKKKAGRPSSFNEALAERIFKLAKSGKTDEQIAQSIGLSRATLQNWKGKHPGFLSALKKAKLVADGLVEASLFQRAIGYSHEAVKIFYDSKRGEVVSEQYTEHYPPDTTAAIFWLKNRQPQNWRERHADIPPATIAEVPAATQAALDEIKDLLKVKECSSTPTPPLSLAPQQGLLAHS